MQERHLDRKRYFDEQALTTRKYVIPFIQQSMPVDSSTSVLEIGCGEGGNLMPFAEIGCERLVGVDLNEGQIKIARSIFEDSGYTSATFIYDDIYNITDIGKFDIIIMRDVIEHIHNQEKFMGFVKQFLKPGGKFFLGFPPWYNPFGGHQQICKSKFLSKLPYFHILPGAVYRQLLKWFGEAPKTIEDLQEIKDTGISIERFERILNTEKYHKDQRVFYFINPNYEVKFKLKPRVAWKWVSAVPFFRNFMVTAMYYVISVPQEKNH